MTREDVLQGLSLLGLSPLWEDERTRLLLQLEESLSLGVMDMDGLMDRHINDKPRNVDKDNKDNNKDREAKGKKRFLTPEFVASSEED